MRKKESRPISRVLSWAIIPLGRPSPCASSGLPGSARRSGAAVLPLLLPYLALLQVGFAMPSVLPPTRCALTAPFHPYQHRFRHFGGLLSVALSVGSRPPGVTWHLDPLSPDFPPPPESAPRGTFRRQRLPGRLSKPHDTASRTLLHRYRVHRRSAPAVVPARKPAGAPRR